MREILIELLVGVASAVLVFLIRLIALSIRQIKNNELRTVVEDLVRYAKQKLTDKTNEEKYIHVFDNVIEYINHKGISISIAEVDRIIEAIYEKVKKEG